MSDEKDPVREQIERDASDFVANLRGIDRAAKQWIREAHDIGATKQDPIAWNRCLDAVKSVFDQLDDSGYQALKHLKKEIEKLRR